MADMFSKVAAYEKLMGRWSTRLAPLFADFAQVRDDSRVLDVGCGTGALVQFLAATTQRTAIVGVDPSQPFIEFSRSRFAGSRFSFDLGNAMELPYSSGSFDQSLSLLVFQFIPQSQKAAGEMRRVTRPRGTVAACTWGYPGLEMSTIFWEEATRLDPAVQTREEKSQRCTGKGQLAELWQATGLEAVEETALEIRMDFSSFDDYWLPFTNSVGTQGVYVDTLSPAHREALREGLRSRLLGDRSDGPFLLPARALAVRGTVPT